MEHDTTTDRARLAAYPTFATLLTDYGTACESVVFWREHGTHGDKRIEDARARRDAARRAVLERYRAESAQ